MSIYYHGVFDLPMTGGLHGHLQMYLDFGICGSSQFGKECSVWYHTMRGNHHCIGQPVMKICHIEPEIFTFLVPGRKLTLLLVPGSKNTFSARNFTFSARW